VPVPPPAATPATLLAAALSVDPARPLLTQYDDATGERVELSATTLDNWVAKTANLLQDEGVEPGARAAVLLPAHWQGAAILLGCWSTGVAIAHGVRGGAPKSADVAFASADRLSDALATGAADVYGLSLAPMAAPLREVPPGVVDYATEVRVHGDRFVPVSPVGPSWPALVFPAGARGPLSQAELVATGEERAKELGLTSGDRLLVVDSPDAPLRPLDWLLVPLAAGASLVLCRNADPDRLADRAGAERATATLGCTVAGIRRADTA
jgi:uncharacterized protein (TIGR03089 family)